jgi:hypothetical protein
MGSSRDENGFTSNLLDRVAEVNEGADDYIMALRAEARTWDWLNEDRQVLMHHIAPISRPPVLAQDGNTSGLEQIVLLLVTVIFQDWDNFPGVIQNLQKFYAKTPEE